MAAATLFDSFVSELGLGTFNLNTDTLKLMATNSAPVVTNTIKGNLTEIDMSQETNHTASADITNTYSAVSGTGTVAAVDVVFLSSGTVGPFQWAVVYDDTPSSPVDPLVCFWNRGSALTLNSGESVTFNFVGDSLMTIA